MKYLVINSDCDAIFDGVHSLTSAGTALLNFLLCLGYDPLDPPIGDLLRKYHNLEGDWLVVSPVYWQASHNDAMILAAGKELELQDAEIKPWFDLFADYLAAEEISLYYHDAETWLLHNPKEHPLNAKPVHQLLNKSLMPELAQLDDTLFWQRFITENQMLFASQPNQSGVNGLWPWGNAKLADKQTIAICTDASFFSLAEQCSSNVSLYNPSINLKEQHILLITELSVLSAQHQDELKKLSAHWYWNNTAYISGASNWFTRLWRKMIHAN